jgi:hypothetical protein
MKQFGVTVSFMLCERKFHHSFLACPPPVEAAGLLCTHFLTESGAIIDLECNTMSLVEVNEVPRENFQTLNEGAAQTFFTRSKE